ncbi:uncharacterized protein LOC122836064 [Gambusia affinis]|uniref:uncharacterized protein LOC122836064 n=1 Tax=Gambusia affinis TaxID=33528 RepID=UPI001CDC3B1E|nr:uncharacterized protein LOC122836064 [Gambusia affinis]XP_043981657.1 uncharacterized protein LOC122836064 [Gambusia affinis]
MGNKNSCNSSLAEGLNGDEKYMLSRFPGSIVYIKKWKNKYKIDGKLKIEKWQTIVGILESSVARKKGMKKAKKEDELRCAKLWLKAAIDRKEQIKKVKDKKLVESNNLFVRSEENEMVLTRRNTSAGQREQVRPTAPPPTAAAALSASVSVSTASTNTLFVKPEDNEPILAAVQAPPLRARATLPSVSPTLIPAKSPPADLTTDPLSVHTPTKLYPTLPVSPPPLYEEEGAGPSDQGHSYNLRQNRKPKVSYSLEGTEQYPMIQVPNPNPRDGQPPHIYVFRPWTLKEARKAVEGITPVSEDPDKWIEDMTGLIHSYRLNGVEAGEAAMSSLGKDWAKVRGSYTGKVINNNILIPIPYPPGANPALSDDFKAQWDPLCERVRTNFRKRANYSHLSGIKQKTGEDVDDFRLRFEKEFKVHSGITYDEGPESVYQQQLKNALMSSFRPEIEGWIKKHLVEYDVASVPQLMTWARHAEKVVKKPKTGSDVFHLEDFGEVDTSVLFRGSSRGRERNSGRGGHYEKPLRSYTPQKLQHPDGCWHCGHPGHWARHCPENKINHRRGGRWEKKQKPNSST